MEEITMSLGELINSNRVNRRLGLRAFARDINIAPSYLSDIENDRRVPSEEVLRRISKALKIDFDILMLEAGRLGKDAEQYIRDNELAVQLFRRIADSQLDQERLKALLARLDEMEMDEDKE